MFTTRTLSGIFHKGALAALMLAVALPVIQSAQAQQPDPIIIKFSHVTAPDTPKGLAAEYYRKLVDERTNGRVKIEVYPNSQLYKDKEELEALQLGAVQMLAPSVPKFGPLGVREFEAFDLPYLFEDEAELHKVTQGPIGQQMLGKLEAKGITGLAFWDNGFRSMTANKPLRDVADFRGLKMRIESSKTLDALTRALGGLPQVMAFSEVYNAMQTGVVDGSSNTISNIYTQKFYEVQKYLTLSEHAYIGYVVITNSKFWNGLPDDIRTILEDAMVDATAYANSIAKSNNDAALAAIRSSGKTEILTLTAEEKAEWRKVLLPVHKDMADRIGVDTLRAVYAELGRKPAF